MIALPRRTARSHAGFSLIELIITVAIIAILAAVAIPIFLNQRTKAMQSNLERDMSALKTAVYGYQPVNIGTTPFAGSLQAALNADGFDNTVPNELRLSLNCTFGPGSTVVASPGNFIVRGIVNNGGPGTVRAGTEILIYDSATDVTERATWVTSRWTAVNAANSGGTCQHYSTWV